MSSPIDDILSQISLPQLAGRLGVDEHTAEQATRAALPALLGGLEANAADPAGASSISQALAQHGSGLVDGGVDLADVDTADGDKIVGHIFGDRQEAVVGQLGGLGGLGGDGQSLISRLLPLLAPIVMSYLAKSMSGSAGQSGAGGLGGGLGDLLGGILGGAGGGGATPGATSATSSITDLLGGLLGGGRR